MPWNIVCFTEHCNLESLFKRTHFNKPQLAFDCLQSEIFLPLVEESVLKPEEALGRSVLRASPQGWSLLTSWKRKKKLLLPQLSSSLNRRMHWGRGLGRPGDQFAPVWIVCWKQISSNLPIFSTTPRNWEKPQVNQYTFSFNTPAILGLAWYKMTLWYSSPPYCGAVAERPPEDAWNLR